MAKYAEVNVKELKFFQLEEKFLIWKLISIFISIFVENLMYGTKEFE